MKKIITGQFSDALPPIMDGVANVASNYALLLDRTYGQSYSIGPKTPSHQPASSKDLRYRSFPIPMAYPYRYGLPGLDAAYRKKVKTIPFDIVHAHSPFVSGAEVLRLSRSLGIPAVTTFHSKYRDDFLRYVKQERIVDRALAHTMAFYEKVDEVWVPNESSGETMRAYGYTGNYIVMPNGTDFAVPEAAERDRLRKRGRELTGSTGKECSLLFVGQHTWKKNIRLVIEGLQRLAETQTAFHMVFVGTGPDERQIRELAARCKVDQHMTFMGMIEDREVLRTIYAASDLFVFPSMYDNAPIVVREAAAYGIPSILLAGSNATNGITDGVNGFIIENSAEGLAQKLSALIGDPKLVSEAGRNASRSVCIHWEDIVDEVYDRYIHLIDRRSL